MIYIKTLFFTNLNIKFKKNLFWNTHDVRVYNIAIKKH